VNAWLLGLALAGARTLVVGPGGDFSDLAAALAAARDGDTVEVRGGVHAGPFVVDRAVRLRGVGRPVLDGGGRGTVLTFEAPGGALEGFDVRGSGDRNDKEDAGVIARGRVELVDNVFQDVLYGIDVKAGPGSTLLGNTVTGRDLDPARKGDAIRLWESHDSRVEANRVDGARDVVIWYSNRVTVRGNTVRHSRYGLHFMYASGSQVLDNTLARNAVGAYAMYSADLVYRGNRLLGNHGPSGYGLALKDTSRVTVADNVVAGNRTGLYFDNSPQRPEDANRITGNTVAYNDIGVAFLPAVRGNVFVLNRFVENFQQVAVVTSGAFKGNSWAEGGRGNYWSGYAGFDADRDGVGDLPYRQESLFDDLVARHPSLRLFSLSPAERMLDLAARAFPVFRPPPVLTDPAPLVVPPPAPVTAPPADPRPLAAASVALVALALATGAWGAALDPAGRFRARRGEPPPAQPAEVRP
jgi:nitrous oxidase accessory protein